MSVAEIRVARRLLWALLFSLAISYSVSTSAQAPPGGSAPSVQVAAFDRQDVNCGEIVNKAMQGNGLLVDAVSPVSVVAQNGAVAAAITCFPELNSKTSRFMIVTASTDDLTARWYSNDLQERVQQAINRAPITGSGECPTRGQAVVISFERYSATNDVQHANFYTLSGLQQNGMSLVQTPFVQEERVSGFSGEVTAKNAHAWVIMNFFQQTPVNDRQLTKGVVIAVSTDAAVAKWYSAKLRTYPNAAGL